MGRELLAQTLGRSFRSHVISQHFLIQNAFTFCYTSALNERRRFGIALYPAPQTDRHLSNNVTAPRGNADRSSSQQQPVLTHTANQRPPLGEGCCHWLRGVSGRDAVWTGTEWAGDRELRLGFRLHHQRVVNPFEGRAEETGGDSVRCFSYTKGARPFPAEDRGLLGDESCPAAAAGGSPELSPLPCAIRTAENQGRTRRKGKLVLQKITNRSMSGHSARCACSTLSSE
ncbi:uncharacterized protein LOC132385952 [Hypanus sabinus]|uniref:uncharacterized protein LOC132385952 n=1 Tax=Hypanus sabinus TaxID=79690 RepID=UPI0028C41D91|nr:uncharacterized protein LOC132385952 [Hypanus sabinus]